jgi:hypothetical protein
MRGDGGRRRRGEKVLSSRTGSQIVLEMFVSMRTYGYGQLQSKNMRSK